MSDKPPMTEAERIAWLETRPCVRWRCDGKTYRGGVASVIVAVRNLFPGPQEEIEAVWVSIPTEEGGPPRRRVFRQPAIPLLEPEEVKP